MRPWKLFVPATLAFTLLAAAFADDKKDAGSREPDVIYIPTPHAVVEKMLELARIGKDDVVYDLGCGDGRIVIAAAGKGCKKAVGIDIDPKRIRECQANLARATKEVQGRVEFRQKDFFELDLSEATVVTLYLLDELNDRLVPQLKKLKPGSRIVSHEFKMMAYKPDRTLSVRARDDDGVEDDHDLYLWTAPLKRGK